MMRLHCRILHLTLFRTVLTARLHSYWLWQTERSRSREPWKCIHEFFFKCVHSFIWLCIGAIVGFCMPGFSTFQNTTCLLRFEFNLFSCALSSDKQAHNDSHPAHLFCYSRSQSVQFSFIWQMHVNTGPV